MQLEDKVMISASAERVFSLYSDVENWSNWHPFVKAASLDGKFVSGVAGILKRGLGRTAKVSFTGIVENQSFILERKLPLCIMRIEHQIMEAKMTHVDVLNRISFKGLLSPLFRKMLTTRLRKDLPLTLRGLKRAAEHS